MRLLRTTLVLLVCLSLLVAGGKKNKDRGGKKGKKHRQNRPIATTATPPAIGGRLMKPNLRRQLSQQNGPLTPVAHVGIPLRALDVAVGIPLTTTQGTSNRLSEEEKAIFLDAHNQFRSEAQPYASNMVKLQWDDSLAHMAQIWADRCTFSHGHPDNISPFNYVGQNLWAGSGPLSNWNHFDMVKSWDDEKEYYNYNSNSCSSVCGHYTQIVWADTTHVGCALAACSTLQGVGWSPASILVCNYGEGGNYVGEKPYISGYPCSQCPSGYDTCVRTQLCADSSAEDNIPGAGPPVEPGSDHGIPGSGPSDQPCGSSPPDLQATSSAQVLESPKFPQPYDNELSCEWTIHGQRGYRISIEFLFMSIEESSQCTWDYLAVFADDLNYNKYCGTTTPANIVSSAGSVTVRMVSDHTVNGGGFKLRYRMIMDAEPGNGEHGGTVTGTKGAIKSPGYPDRYPHNLDIVWTIKVAKKKRVRLTVKSMDIEYHAACHYDFLSITLGAEVVPMRLCGSEVISGRAYVSLTNEVVLHFKTDTQGAARGFDVRWKAI